MLVLRRLGLILSLYAFRSLLFATALVTAVVLLLGSPAKLKSTLHDSGAYNSFVDYAVDQAASVSKKEANSDIPLDDPQIQAAAKQAFPASRVQRYSESVIDGVYGWLEGKTAKPHFTIDTTVAKLDFAEGIGASVRSRLASLPPCTTMQLRQLGNADIDPFTVPCLPPGMNVDGQTTQLVNDLATNQDFVSKGIITADNLPKNAEGQDVFDQFQVAPTLFPLLRLASFPLGLLTLLAAAGVIYLHSTRRQGWRTLSQTLMFSGVFLAISSGVLHLLFNRFRPVGNAFQSSILRLLDTAINRILLIFGIIYALTGLAIWLILRRSTPSDKPRGVYPKTTKGPLAIRKF
jgi:hypothetical protein